MVLVTNLIRQFLPAVEVSLVVLAVILLLILVVMLLNQLGFFFRTGEGLQGRRGLEA